MVKISDISKDGIFCCEYHKNTFQMLIASHPLHQSIPAIEID